MESMEILLSPDNYSPLNCGSYLQIWKNIKTSIIALESGLTAMKCVDTANVATNVVFDVMSLMNIAGDKKYPLLISISFISSLLVILIVLLLVLLLSLLSLLLLLLVLLFSVLLP